MNDSTLAPTLLSSNLTTTAQGEHFHGGDGHGHDYNHYPFWFFLAIETGVIITGNVLLCWLFLTQRRLRTKQNYFIISLSVADLLVGLAVAPCEYCRWVNDKSWATCPIFCGSVISFNMVASVINLLIIAVDRYISVEKALSYQQIFSKRRIVSIIIGIWILAIFMTLVPFTWFFSPISGKTKDFINVLFAALMFSLTIIAGLILFIFYRHIIQVAWLKMRSHNIQRPPSMVGMTVCIVSTAIFFVSWTAYCTIEILLQCYINVPDEVIDVGYFVLLLSPCADPVLYAYYRKDFRKHLIDWLKHKYRILCPCGSAKQLQIQEMRALQYNNSGTATTSASPNYSRGSSTAHGEQDDELRNPGRSSRGQRKGGVNRAPTLKRLEAEAMMEYNT